jgi:uncharacterized protein (DUF1800 family)
MKRHLSVSIRCGLLASLLAVGAAALDAQNRPPAQTASSADALVTHVLNRVAFGPRAGDVERVGTMGIASYIDEQLHPERIDDRALEGRLAAFESLDMSTRELVDKYFAPALELQRRQQNQRPNPNQAGQPAARPGQDRNSVPPAGDATQMTPQPPPAAPAVTAEARQAAAAQRTVLTELSQARLLRAVYSERQLQEVLTDFWFNHFNVFMGKGQVRQYLTEYERDVIRPNVLGSFRTLLGAVAHSPAMLFYLDNWQSATPNPPIIVSPAIERQLDNPRLTPEQRRQILRRVEEQRMRRPQAQRGLNENYARELMELHTLGVDGGYTQADVIALARILTGWTIDQPRNGGSYVFRPMLHDTGTKTLLGTTFGNAGELEGERALDLLAAHPSTARHIAFKLAQRFIADEPPASVVDRVAKVFTSTKGDLRAVTHAVLTSPEFVSPAAIRAKVKTPLEFVVSAVRATGATITNAQPLVVALQNLGMPLYGCQPPTGYSMTADAWVSTGALLNRMNFAVQLLDGGRVPPPGRGAGAGAGGEEEMMAPAGRGNAAGPARAARQGGPRAGRGGAFVARGPVQIDIATLAPDTSERSRDQAVARLIGSPLSDTTSQTLARAEHPRQLLALTLGSPEFQRR